MTHADPAAGSNMSDSRADTIQCRIGVDQAEAWLCLTQHMCDTAVMHAAVSESVRAALPGFAVMVG